MVSVFVCHTLGVMHGCTVNDEGSIFAIPGMKYPVIDECTPSNDVTHYTIIDAMNHYHSFDVDSLHKWFSIEEVEGKDYSIRIFYKDSDGNSGIKRIKIHTVDIRTAFAYAMYYFYPNNKHEITGIYINEE